MNHWQRYTKTFRYGEIEKGILYVESLDDQVGNWLNQHPKYIIEHISVSTSDKLTVLTVLYRIEEFKR